MEKKAHESQPWHEQFVPPKPFYVESDTTGEARPPVLEYLARHYRSQYDLEKIKVYNNHAMNTCYNLPWEDVTEHFETSATPIKTYTMYTLRYNYNTDKAYFVDTAGNEYSSLSYDKLNYQGVLGFNSQPKLDFKADKYKISDGNTIIIMGSNDTKTLGPLRLKTGSAKIDANTMGGNIYLPITFSVNGSN